MSVQFFLKRTKEYALSYSPTALAANSGNIYIAVKGKALFFIPLDSRKLESVPFVDQITSLAAGGNALYCGCKGGDIIGITSKHSTCFKASIDKTPITHCAYDPYRSEILASSHGRKIVIFGDNGIQKNSHFFYTTPVVSFRFTKEGMIAGISENNQVVRLVDSIGKSHKELKLSGGFPESIIFSNREHLLVGTNTGSVQLYSLKTMKLVAECNTGASVITLCCFKDNTFLLGTTRPELLILSVEGSSMEIAGSWELEGIPVAIEAVGDEIVLALGREPRLGRWGRMSKGKNRIVFIKIEERDNR